MRYEIYGRENCIFCERAKALCGEKKLDFTYHDISDEELRKQMFSLAPNAKTVPQIFLISDGSVQPIGGFTEFHRKISQLENTCAN
jgi:glutaredoxin